MVLWLMWIVVIMLIVFGIFLGVVDYVGVKCCKFDDFMYLYGIVFGFV